MNSPCKICEKRRAKRRCPGVGGDICPGCCGLERENTIDCPRDCTHLREARKREHPVELPLEKIPNQDIKLSEQFLRDQEHVLLWLGQALTRAMESAKAVDSDALRALPPHEVVTEVAGSEQGLALLTGSGPVELSFDTPLAMVSVKPPEASSPSGTAVYERMKARRQLRRAAKQAFGARLMGGMFFGKLGAAAFGAVANASANAQANAIVGRLQRRLPHDRNRHAQGTGRKTQAGICQSSRRVALP